MPLTAPPAAPTPSDTPEVFDAQIYARLVWDATNVTELNALQIDVTGKQAAASAAAVVASAQAVLAVNAAASATGAANFKGEWSTLAGTLNRPACVKHGGRFWLLLSDLVDVTTATPGVSAAWTVMGTIGQSFRNKIINGSFAVNQREVSGTVALAAGIYGHDRWKAGASGCTYTFSTSSNVTTITISAGSLQQVIEGLNLQSGTHVLSWVGTAQGRIAAGSYGASGVTGTATGGANLTVEFNAGTLSFVQLEAGGTVSDFEIKPYPTELFACQRYLPPISKNLPGFVYANNSLKVISTFHVPTRVAPTGVVVTGVGNIQTAAVQQPASSLLFDSSGVNSALLVVAYTPSTLTVGQGGLLKDVSGYFTGCEL